MTDTDARHTTPATGVWRRFLLLIPMAVIMFVVCTVHIARVGSTYHTWTPVADRTDYSGLVLDDVMVSNPNVVQATELIHGTTGAACVTLQAVSDGDAVVELRGSRYPARWNVHVSGGTLFVNNVNFNGWRAIHVCVCVGLGVIAILFASVVVRLHRCSWYGYEMVAAGGGLLFSLFQFAIFVVSIVRNSFLNFDDMAAHICDAAGLFVIVSLVPMGILALLVSVSNIWLMRHEGTRPTNMLGIAISVVWLVGIFVWGNWWRLGVELRVSYEVLAAVDTFISVAICLGECLLLSTIACAIAASRHVPAQACDYLIILGCGLRDDGTPSPLLAGRVDRSYDFDRACVADGAAPATFVPSGGQGPDEVISEAQSMADYLADKDIPRSNIVLEDSATTTRENMAYSREVIEEHAGRSTDELRIGFSTTNYHVFRGYVCAHDAGMEVQGLGARTRPYFWPNAFLREFAGLMVAQWRPVLQTYVLIALVYVLARLLLLLN